MTADFVARLAATPAPPGCANPYSLHEPGIDTGPDAPEIRARQLAAYLERRRGARAILLAEAPGYQGARFSGIAMTCERMLLDRRADVPAAAILGSEFAPQRTSTETTARNAAERRGGFLEPTASVVWGELIRHGLADRVVLWNVFPFHPRRDGALTNRTPTRDEVSTHLPLTHAFLDLFPEARVICVGNTARDHMRASHPDLPTLRHPANGGAGTFRQGFAALAPDL